MKPAVAGDDAVLVAIGSIDPSPLEFLALALPDAVGLPFRIHPRALPVDSAYEPVRRQWNASIILAELAAAPELGTARRILGVGDVDLFIPILTFVFGLAHLGARVALVSLHRLHAEFYGLPEDPELLLRRLEKEALHELGHTAGLIHCHDYACVMHYSNAVEEVDLKSASFCGSCRQSLRFA